jgi:hypothetical protein
MTKADQIRELAAAGLSPAEIAAKVGVRYQHVYNVLKRSGALSTVAARQQVNHSNHTTNDRQPMPLAELIARGFQVVGNWQLADADGDKIEFNGELPRTPGVYAFAVDGTVVYIGVSERDLRQRIKFYAKPGPRQLTSIRINGLVASELRAGKSITLAIAAPEDGKWNDFSIPMHTALEAGLIKQLRPEWNISKAYNHILPN